MSPRIRIRASILDVTAVAVVLVVLFLPARGQTVRPAYAMPDEQTVRQMDAQRGRLAVAPDDGDAAYELASLLLDVGQTDWAIRVGGAAAAHTDSPSLWHAYLAISSAHTERVEIDQAHRYAKLALDACEKPGSNCPAHEKARVMLYFYELDAGKRSGVDPRVDPAAFRDAVNLAFPRAHLRGSGG